ncbi:MAG: DUF421 domain-containing protein [Oscillospiraceae bacterium]|nr:DUF421 domain-containing protein [Oscillospiraceae bacterium]
MIISIIRTILLYALIIISLRLMGKRQIGDLQTTELVVTFMISDLASLPMQDTSVPMLDGVIPILILIACEITISVLMIRHTRFRTAVCGNPVIVIKDGKVLEKEMKRLRMSVEDLFVELRQKDVFNIEEVQYCIVETNGQVSLLKKPANREPSAKDLSVKIDDTGLEVVVVSDGNLMKRSVGLCNLKVEDIKKALQAQNTELKDVFIMTADKTGKFNIIKKDTAA